MQNKKANWRLVRSTKPCRFCGNAEHTTGECPRFTKKGKPRPQPQRQLNRLSSNNFNVIGNI